MLQRHHTERVRVVAVREETQSAAAVVWGSASAPWQLVNRRHAVSHWIEHPERPRVGEEEEAAAAVLEDVLAGALDLDAGQEEVAAADHRGEEAVRVRRVQGRGVEARRGGAVAVGGDEVAEEEWVVVDVAEAAEEGGGGGDADPVLGGEDGAVDGGGGRQAEQDVCHYIVGKGVNGGVQWPRCRGGGGDLALLLVLHHLQVGGKRIRGEGGVDTQRVNLDLLLQFLCRYDPPESCH